MPSGRPWLRLYTRLKDDVRVRVLSDQEFRIFILLLCMAGENERQGYIEMAPDDPWTADDIALAFGVAGDEFENAIARLIHLHVGGLVREETGILHFEKWDELQYESDFARDRTRAYRERRNSHSDVAVPSQHSHQVVTVTAQETEEETETETEEEAEAEAEAGGENAAPLASSATETALADTELPDWWRSIESEFPTVEKMPQRNKLRAIEAWQENLAPVGCDLKLEARLFVAYHGSKKATKGRQARDGPAKPYMALLNWIPKAIEFRGQKEVSGGKSADDTERFRRAAEEQRERRIRAPPG